jgi:hypothetical protein
LYAINGIWPKGEPKIMASSHKTAYNNFIQTLS